MVWGVNYNGVVEYNTMIGNQKQTSSCIYLSQTSDSTTIRYNTFKYGNYGIFSMAKETRVFYNAFIYNNIAVSIQDNSNLIAQNNTFHHNRKYAITSKENTTVTSLNNIFSKEANSIVYYIKGSIISDYNFFSEFTNVIDKSNLSNWQQSYSQDQHSKSGNPKFADVSILDLSLMDDSPCIDRGINVGLMKDFFGTKINAQSEIDIGYHELIK
jgi:hypothetical protein